MFRFLLYFFLIYLGYQFIFNFLIPIFKTTQQVKKGVREMHDRLNEFGKAQQNSSSPQTKSPDKSSKAPTEDYIDFEEIK
jgi:hypothetical protein